MYFAGLGRPAIGDSDEAYYAEAGREMAATGDWLTPHYSGQPRFQKPILTYWLIAGTYTLTGVGEAGARTWSALAGLVLALATAAIGRRWYDEATGQLGGAIVATGFGYFSIARLALPDLPLSAFVTLAIYATLRAGLGRRASTARLVGRRRRPHRARPAHQGTYRARPRAPRHVPLLGRRPPGAPRIARGAALAFAVALVVALPWYVAMTASHGREYLQGFLVGDNIERFATARYNDPRPWWFYVPILAGGLLPWTPLALCAVGPLARAWREPAPTSTTWRLTWWALGPLLFFTASIGKQPRYILPILPPLALLIARGILAYLRAAGLRRRHAAIRAAGAITGVHLVGLAVLLYRAMPVIVSVEPRLVWTGALLIALGGACHGHSLAGRPGWIPIATAATGALALAGLQFGLAPADRDPVQTMAAHVLAQRPDRARGWAPTACSSGTSSSTRTYRPKTSRPPTTCVRSWAARSPHSASCACATCSGSRPTFPACAAWPTCRT